jgi:hypothetical protein
MSSLKNFPSYTNWTSILESQTLLCGLVPAYDSNFPITGAIVLVEVQDLPESSLIVVFNDAKIS